MNIKDHFLTQEDFQLVKTNIDGILKTSPLPADLGKYYQSTDYISHHQDSGSLKEKIYKLFQKLNLTYKRNILNAELGVGTKILDYGCGAGEFVHFIESEFQTYAYEPSKDARKYAEQKNKNTIFINSLEEIENESLDAITLWHVFEHIENREEILSLFYSKLKQNGCLIIAVPNHTSYDAKKYKNFWAAYDVPRHIWHYSKNGMQKYFNTENWKLNKIKPLLLDSYYISILSEKYKKSPLFLVKGAIFGAISNFKAVKTGEFSSLIYIIEKK